MIWKEALPERRFVHLHHTSLVRNYRRQVTKPGDYLFSTTFIPAVLHACSESRHIAIAAGWVLEFCQDGKEGRVWFNFEKDVVYFPNLRTQLWDQRKVSDEMTVVQSG